MTTTKDELLDQVVERVWERLDEDQAPQVEEFVRQYYSWVAPEDLAGLSPIDIYGAAVAHWNFALQREPDRPKIRVYNPRFEEYRWQTTHTVIEIVNDDMPFLVDSVRAEVSRQGYSIHLMVHPVMNVRRDDEGRLTEVLAPEDTPDDAASESIIHVEVDRHTETEALEKLRDGLVSVLGDVRAAVEDWPKMREQVQDIVSGLNETELPIDEEEVSEAQAFLEWLDSNHFTFLGYREYDLATENGEDTLHAVSGSGLGILRDKESGNVSQSFNRLPPEARKLAREKRLLNLTKANSRADRPSPVPTRLRWGKEVRRKRRGRRGAAFLRPVHLLRVHREHARDTDTPSQGAVLPGRGWIPGRQPQREGPDRDSRNLPAGRDVPDPQTEAV